jgi:hypothetical protein
MNKRDEDLFNLVLTETRNHYKSPSKLPLYLAFFTALIFGLIIIYSPRVCACCCCK